MDKMHFRRALTLAALSAHFLIPHPARGDGTSPAQIPVPQRISATRPITLAQALAQAKSGDGVGLIVDADGVNLPPETSPPEAEASVTFIGNAYGRSVRDFGSVTAVAPPTMIVINASPSDPNPFDGMPPPDALALLCASLSDGQWQSFTSAQGLGVADLTTEAQRQLLQQVLSPGGKLKVIPRSLDVPGYHPSDVLDVTDQLDQAHLRLSQAYRFDVPVVGSPQRHTFFFSELPDAPGGPDLLRPG